MILRFVAAAAVFAALSVVAACGSGGHQPSLAEYQTAVVLTRDRVDFAFGQITEGQGTLAQLLERMKTAALHIDEAADYLNDVGGAKGFEADTDELVHAFHQLSVDLKATAEQIEQPGFEELGNARGLNFESWDKANQILATLRQKGIPVKPLERH